MPASPIVPCLWFDDQAEAAAAVYVRTFPGGRILATSRAPESFDIPGGRPRGSLLTVELEVAGQRFTALNGGPMFRPNPSLSFFLFLDSAADVDRIGAALLDGGQALMPVGAWPWSERYGWIQDRFGVSWQVMLPRERGGGAVVPCLMFSGPRHGRAEEAMRAWTGIFPGGRIESVARYEPGEGPEGTVKHGRFVLAGQPMAAMDSHLAHDLGFTEGISLQVTCRDQAEVDRYWAALSEGGRPGPCGWLQDRFGLSWQVVPAALSEWMSSPDAAARDRAFRELLGMQKPDVARLRAAFEGR